MSLYQLCERFQEPLDASIFRSFKAKIDDTKRKYIEANIKIEHRLVISKILIDKTQ